MQRQQEIHKLIDGGRTQRLPSRPVEEQQRHLRSVRIGRGAGRHGQEGIVLTEGHEQRDFTRPLLERRFEHGI